MSSRVSSVSCSESTLPTIEIQGRRFELHPPLRVSVSQVDQGTCLATCQSDAISGFGATPEAAIEDLMHAFDFAWEAYASAEDTELAPDAQRLKAWLVSVVSSVGQVGAHA